MAKQKKTKPTVEETRLYSFKEQKDSCPRCGAKLRKYAGSCQYCGKAV